MMNEFLVSWHKETICTFPDGDERVRSRHLRFGTPRSWWIDVGIGMPLSPVASSRVRQWALAAPCQPLLDGVTYYSNKPVWILRGRRIGLAGPPVASAQ